MQNRPRTWLAAPGAILLVLAVSGAVLGASVLTVAGPAPEEVTDPLVADTATWEDIDGNGVDDDCQEGTVEADPAAVLTALAAIDADGDGTISVDEAAHSAWIGGAELQPRRLRELRGRGTGHRGGRLRRSPRRPLPRPKPAKPPSSSPSTQPR